jgi:hypothetical protein
MSKCLFSVLLPHVKDELKDTGTNCRRPSRHSILDDLRHSLCNSPYKIIVFLLNMQRGALCCRQQRGGIQPEFGDTSPLMLLCLPLGCIEFALVNLKRFTKPGGRYSAIFY